MKPQVVISLFDRTGNMVRPWAEAGFKCHIFDIRHEGSEQGKDNIWRHHADLSTKNFLYDFHFGQTSDVVFVSCQPPCDHLALSGTRWMNDVGRGKGLRALQESIGYFATSMEVCDEFDAPYILENPMSMISTYWRSADHKFNPWHFAGLEPDDHYRKESWVWCGNGFVMPIACPLDFELVGLPDERIHRASPGPERSDFRAATPMGFSRAVFGANRPDKVTA